MGCQGEIYNVYGVVVPATINGKAAKYTGPDLNSPVVYNINGRTISDGYNEEYDHYQGIPTVPYSVKDPALVIRVLGDSSSMGSRHFRDTALVGYPVANQCYLDFSTPLPSFADIEALKPALHKELKDKLGLDLDPNTFGLHLMFDSINGY